MAEQPTVGSCTYTEEYFKDPITYHSSDATKIGTFEATWYVGSLPATLCLQQIHAVACSSRTFCAGISAATAACTNRPLTP